MDERIGRIARYTLIFAGIAALAMWIASPLMFRQNPTEFDHVQKGSDHTNLESVPFRDSFFNTNQTTWHTRDAQVHGSGIRQPIRFSVPDQFFHEGIFSATDPSVTIHDTPFATSEFADCAAFSEHIGDASFTTTPIRTIIDEKVVTACRNSLPTTRGSTVSTLHFYAFSYQTRLATLSVTFRQPNCAWIQEAYRYSRSVDAKLVAACNDIETYDPDTYFRSVVQTIGVGT
ncbi:MAG: hypothetical protein OYG31_01600 [Candidatus Kaiserbacteria bacterium]|nr:hypothetical protein [Candidatus Kaiserbacteria bacterium]